MVQHGLSELVIHLSLCEKIREDTQKLLGSESSLVILRNSDIFLMDAASNV